MKKTIFMASLINRDYKLERRVWEDSKGNRFVKIGGNWFGIDWLMMHGTEVELVC